MYLDSLALALGTAGTIAWSHNGRMALYAAFFWLFSSVLWILYALQENLPALGMRDLINVAFYLYGSWRWLRPKQSEKDPQTA
jgi:hypothetical protein